jgi:hypothetical protein
MLVKNINAVAKFTCLYALIFQLCVKQSSEMQFCVIYLEAWTGKQPYLAIWILEHCSCFFIFNGTNTVTDSLPFQRPVLVAPCVKAFSWLIDVTCLPCLVVWGHGTPATSCIMSLTNVSLKSWSNDFEPQEVRMIKLLRMVNSRKHLYPLSEPSANAVKVCHAVTFVLLSHMSTVTVLGQRFATLIIEATLCQWRKRASVPSLFACLSTPWLPSYPSP